MFGFLFGFIAAAAAAIFIVSRASKKNAVKEETRKTNRDKSIMDMMNKCDNRVKVKDLEHRVIYV